MVMMYHPYSIASQRSGRDGRRRKLTGVMTALVLAPLLGATGYGFDVARGAIVQSRLSHAVDAAALAGGRVFFDTQRDGHINKFFDTAFPRDYLGSHSGPLEIAVDPAAGTLTVGGRATVRGTFLRLFGMGDLTVQATSVVHRPVRGADPVLSHRD